MIEKHKNRDKKSQNMTHEMPLAGKTQPNKRVQPTPLRDLVSGRNLVM